MRIFHFAFVTSLTLACSGCALLMPRERITVPAIESTSGANPDITPFTLEVLNENNDGEKLTVHGRFIPKVDWRSDQILVRISALDGKGEQRQSYFIVQGDTPSPGASTTLAAGVATEFTLSLPASDISNYQLELLWGNDAAPFMKAANAPKEGEEFLALRNLEVYRVPGDSCATPDECVMTFTLTGEFFNAGSATISKVVLKAGFGRAGELDLPDQILENERKIEVRNMHLAPGKTRPFRLALEKHIPSSTQVAPRPVLRILSVESAKDGKQ